MNKKAKEQLERKTAKQRELAWFKKNRKEFCDYGWKWFLPVENNIENPTEEEYIEIVDAAYRAFLYLYERDEDNSLTISQVADYLAKEYANKNVTLEELREARAEDIVEAFEEGKIWLLHTATLME